MSSDGPARRLPSCLIDLAGGRDPGRIEVDDETIAVARDHRVVGLLWSHLRSTGQTRMDLAMIDLQIQAHQQRIWALAERAVEVARLLDVEVAMVKGCALERRFYGRDGERPSSDVDLLVAPSELHRIPELVMAFQPDHSWIPYLPRMVRRKQIQSVTVAVDRMEVDIHLDVLKLGIHTRQADQAWAALRTEQLPNGAELRVLDDTWTLLLLLAHLNKDRFQRLLGYADVVRVVRHGAVDPDQFWRLAEGEGLTLPMARTLRTVERDLHVDLRFPTPNVGGLSAAAWDRLWRPEIRLLGREGRERFRYRQDLIPLLANGRRTETVRWWSRELFPPAGAVAAEYPDTSGPYPVRLVRGRLAAKRAKQRAEASRGATPPSR